MTRERPLAWYAWAALIGIITALFAVGGAMFWVWIGVDPLLASLGIPAWLGHGLLTALIVYLLARGVKRVMAP